MKSMSKKLLWGLTLLMFLTVASNAFAGRGTSAVSNTVHNLSTTAPAALYTDAYKSSNETEVCIFCHTPHGGRLDGPLWNKNLPDGTAFTFYSSSTMDADTAVTEISAESLLCLSCHDGSISVNELMNYNTVNPILSASNGSETNKIVIADGGSARIGGGPANWGSTVLLSDDHPISFSYNTVKGNYDTAGKDGLHLAGDAVASGIQFFGDTNRVECSSCHDPHVDYETNMDYYPFLITPNIGSALCFACHDK